MKNKLTTIVIALAILALFVSWFEAPAHQVNAAPAMAVLTPVSNNNTNNGVHVQTFFNGPITADTYKCFDLSTWDVMDLQYRIDQGTSINTMTLTMQRYNIAPPDVATPIYESGATVVNANAADAHGDLQVPLFDRYTCVFADVSNTNVVTPDVVGLAKVMPRTDYSAVVDIIATTLDISQVNAFISTANLLVNQKLGNSGLDDTLLTEIEKYLAAHLVCLRDPRMQSKGQTGQMGSQTTTYQGQTAMRLESTQYGQTVQMLDPTGAFANAGLRPVTFEAF